MAFYVLLMPTMYNLVFPELFYIQAMTEEVTVRIFIYVGFRGFLGKRLIARFGFAVGNTIQAVVFGLLHITYVLFDKMQFLLFLFAHKN